MHKPSQQAPTFRGRYKGLCRYRLFLATYRLGQPVDAPPRRAGDFASSESVEIQTRARADIAVTPRSIGADHEPITADIDIGNIDGATLPRTQHLPHRTGPTTTAAATPATAAAALKTCVNGIASSL